MTALENSGNPESDKKHPTFDDIPSLALYKELQEGKRREIRRRIDADFYDRADIINETARKIIESGDLPATD